MLRTAVSFQHCSNVAAMAEPSNQAHPVAAITNDDMCEAAWLPLQRCIKNVVPIAHAVADKYAVHHSHCKEQL